MNPIRHRALQNLRHLSTISQRRAYTTAFTACQRQSLHQLNPILAPNNPCPNLRRNPLQTTSLLPQNILPPTIPSRARRRDFSTSTSRQHGHLDPPKPGEERHVTFIDKEGNSHEFTVADGDNLLDIAQANDLEMEGACGGSCACSTCHIILASEEIYNQLEEPSDDENDMLDLAFGLTETSRLGCQVKMSKDLDGLVVRLPSMTRNMQASDFGGKNEPHGS